MADLAVRELHAAGITGIALQHAYTRCRALHAEHGRTYFLATRLLTPARRPAVHALYGFARYVDEIVDALDDTRSAAEKLAALDRLEPALLEALNGGPATDPVLVAVADTARRYQLDAALFTAFLAAMRMDTHVTDYPTFDALAGYMYGSAAVIGLQMLPVLGIVGDRDAAADSAAALGVAFQLTNFLRDVGEDLDRGRVYLPADELAAFGVDRALLSWCHRRRRPDPRVRRALAHLVARTRAVYRRAAPGIALLDPVSRPCVHTAYTLYGAILDLIEAADYDVLNRRVSVPVHRRLVVALPALVGSHTARRRATPRPGPCAPDRTQTPS